MFLLIAFLCRGHITQCRHKRGSKSFRERGSKGVRKRRSKHCDKQRFFIW